MTIGVGFSPTKKYNKTFVKFRMKQEDSFEKALESDCNHCEMFNFEEDCIDCMEGKIHWKYRKV